MTFGYDPFDGEPAIVGDAMLQQHAEIAEVLDLVIEHCRGNRSPAELASELDALLQLLQMHFRCEENLGVRGRRPKSPSHLDAHRRMLEYLVKLRRDADEDAARLLAELRFFDYWLSSHVVEESARIT